MRRAVLNGVFFTCGLAWAVPARAEIAVLSSGFVLKLDSHRLERDEVVLFLKGGGEMRVAASLVAGYLPDEVIDEIKVPAGADLRSLALAAAKRHGLDPDLVLAVVAVESGFRPQAVSAKGAQGLMQLMPKTSNALGVVDAFDPEQNLDGGARQLRALLALYGGDLGRALAAYNAGQGAVARYKGMPPYPETRSYVKKVLQHYRLKDAKAGAAKGEGAATETLSGSETGK